MNKFLLALCTFLTCLGLMVLPVSAASNEVTFELEHTQVNCELVLEWTNTKASSDVVVNAPDGTVYRSRSSKDFEFQEGSCTLKLEKAVKGKWTVKTTASNLGTLNAYIREREGALQVNSLLMTESSNGVYNLSWNVNSAEDSLKVSVYGTTVPDSFEGKKLYETQGDAIDTTVVEMPDVDSGYYYYYVTFQDFYGNRAAAFCDAVFFYDNPDRADYLENLSVVLMNDQISMTWTDTGDKVKVLVYDTLTKELLTEKIIADQNFCEVDFPAGHDQVSVGAASYRGESLGRFVLKDINKDTGVKVSVEFPETAAINEKYMTFKVTFSGNYWMHVDRNDIRVLDNETSAGVYRIPLEEGDNLVRLIISDAEGNSAVFEKQIALDRFPPEIAWDEDYSGYSTRAHSITLSGRTQPDATLNLEGNIIPVDAEGKFSYTCSLKQGDNNIHIQVSDEAGNVRSECLSISCSWLTEDQMKLVICILIGVFIVLIEVVLIRRGRRSEA